ncbi:hypothetical protein GGS20DRAFT_423528 [Poronia punctata]|nr:hypothetical protein GGS20DRAFT_423528 [Poronia punctata]
MNDDEYARKEEEEEDVEMADGSVVEEIGSTEYQKGGVKRKREEGDEDGSGDDDEVDEITGKEYGTGVKRRRHGDDESEIEEISSEVYQTSRKRRRHDDDDESEVKQGEDKSGVKERFKGILRTPVVVERKQYQYQAEIRNDQSEIRRFAGKTFSQARGKERRGYQSSDSDLEMHEYENDIEEIASEAEASQLDMRPQRYQHQNDSEIREWEEEEKIIKKLLSQTAKSDSEDKRTTMSTVGELNVGTYGVELEFLVVQCPYFHWSRKEWMKDPHQNDGRWISKKMSEWEARRARRIIERMPGVSKRAKGANSSANIAAQVRQLEKHVAEDDDDDVDEYGFEYEYDGEDDDYDSEYGGGGVDGDKDEDGDENMAEILDDDELAPTVIGSDRTRSFHEDEKDDSSHYSYADFHPHFYKRSRYCRTKLTRILRDKGLVVIKWPAQYVHEAERYEKSALYDDFSGSEPSDDEREEPYPNRQFLGDFKSIHHWIPGASLADNVESALTQWERDYVEFHEKEGLKLYRTGWKDIEAILDVVDTSGWPPMTADDTRRMRGHLRGRLRMRRDDVKQEREDLRNKQTDPLHVPVPGLRDQYKAWTVTNDISVNGNGMSWYRYQVPPEMDTPSPFDDYRWFGAEVVSPVFNIADERAKQAIRDACGGLRDQLRIHKPMEVSSGLHVHLGHTQGWLLPQLKRMATFWYLTENVILQLHRKDRGLDRTWCAKIGDQSALYLALFKDEKEIREMYGWAITTNRVEVTNMFANEARAHVPYDSLTSEQMTMVYFIWQYRSINGLNKGLGETDRARTGLKWRVRGVHSSLEKEVVEEVSDYDSDVLFPQPGTVEVRIMQGTLDADHINNWVVVLEHIVRAVRDLTANDYQTLLSRFLEQPTRERLLTVLGVPHHIRTYWLDPKRRNEADTWWEYPDKDRVDWAQPFMVRGHRATHGPAWDD